MVLLMMLGVDLVFIALHLLAASRQEEASLYYVDLEYGHAEAVQSLRWLWCLGLLALVLLRSRRCVFASLAPLLAFMLLTDALEIHERAGRALAGGLGIGTVLGLRPQDAGELLVVALTALVVLRAYLFWLSLDHGRAPDRASPADCLAAVR